MPSTIGTSDLSYALGAYPSRVAAYSAVDGTGKWHLLYAKSTGWYYSTSTDNGVTWSAPAVPAGIGGAPASGQSMAVIADSNGAVHWAGYNNASSNGAQSWDMYGASGWLSAAVNFDTSFRGGALAAYTSGGTTQLWIADPNGNLALLKHVTNPAAASTTVATDYQTFEGWGDGIQVVIMGTKVVLLGTDGASPKNLRSLPESAATPPGSTQFNQATNVVVSNANLGTAFTAATDTSNVLHVIYQITGIGWYETTSSDGVTWTAGTQITQLTANDAWPSLAFDGAGTAHLFYAKYNAANDYGVGYVKKLGGGSWAAQADVVAHNGVNRTNVSVSRAASPGGYSLVTWSEGAGSPYTLKATAVTTGALTPGTLSVSGYSTTSVSLSWGAATGGTPSYTYQVQRAPDVSGSPGAWANIGASQAATTYTDSGLTTATTYWYRVVVTDSTSPTPQAANSNQVSQTTGTPSLTVGAITLGAHTWPTVNLSATATTGGTAPLRYQWYYSATSDFTPGAGNAVAQQTGLALQHAPGLAVGQVGWYKLVVTDSTTPSAQTATYAQAAAPLAAPSLVIGGIGDSLMQQTKTDNVTTKLDVLAHVLGKHLGGRSVTVNNQGIGGTTTANWLPGQTDYVNAVAAFAGMSTPPQYVYYQIGTNDAPGTEPFNQANVTSWIANILLTVADLKGRGYQVILNMPPFQWAGASPTLGQGHDINNEYFQALAAAMDAVCDGATVYRGDRWLFAYFSQHPEEYKDVTHMNDTGIDSAGFAWAMQFIDRVLGGDGARPAGLAGGARG